MSAMKRRLLRLEAARVVEADELVEFEFSEEAKELLRRTLTGRHPPEEVERIVNKREWVPKSRLKPLSPESEARLEAWLEDYRRNPPR